MRRRRRRFWHAAVRLRSAMHRHHPPQRAVLSQICCFGEHKVAFQILLDGAKPGMCWYPLGICIVVRVYNMPKQGKPARLDYSSEFGLLR